MGWNIGAGLESKRVIITGAAGGIGCEVARAFAAAGSRVALLDLRESALQDIAGTLDGSGHLVRPVDLRDMDAFPAMVEDLNRSLGGIDILVNAAGLLMRCASLNDVTEDDWDLQQDVNLKATFFLSRAAAEVMRAQARGGRVINFVSQAWWSGSYSTAVVYAAAKGGAVSMTRGFARNYAKDQITFNAIAPGAIDTDMMRSGLTEEKLQAMIDQIPLGYMAPPSEIAGSVLFLASDHARYMTGTVINVSGGWLMY